MKPDPKKGTAFEIGVSEEGTADEVPSGVEVSNPANSLEHLREQLADAERAASESQDLYLRERAELENFKKRSMRERSEALRYAVEPLARDVIAVVDDLERALKHAQSSGDESPVVAGVELVLKNALETLQRHGVERFDAKGQEFDPAVHEALAQIRDASVPVNHVVEQFLPGYRLHQRLLRAAQVGVSVEPAEDKQ